MSHVADGQLFPDGSRWIHIRFGSFPINPCKCEKTLLYFLSISIACHLMSDVSSCYINVSPLPDNSVIFTQWQFISSSNTPSKVLEKLFTVQKTSLIFIKIPQSAAKGQPPKLWTSYLFLFAIFPFLLNPEYGHSSLFSLFCAKSESQTAPFW